MCMQDWIVDLKERSMQPVLTNPCKQVMRLLNNANLTPLLGAFFHPAQLAGLQFGSTSAADVSAFARAC